jgi:GST-like protein
MITLHYSPTPNCWKVAILLEEARIPYRVQHYDIFAGDHLTAAFQRINPNHKLPAIVDDEPAGGGEPIPVFESGAILVYLAEKCGRFIAPDARGRAATLQWLAWQIAGLGPMLGQANHFVRYAPQPQPYATERYVNESRRLIHVLEHRLGQAQYLAGEYSIADMAAWPWVRFLGLLQLDLADFPNVKRWFDAIEARAAVQRVFTAPETAPNPAYLQASARLTPEQWSNLFGDRMLRAPRTASES